MTRAAKLAKHIHRTVKGPMWHGPALAQVLDGVTHDQAAAHPIAGAHSIWEIVLHVSAWAEIARARIKSARLADPAPDEDWPPVTATGAEDWERALERLSESHRALSAAVRDLPDDTLEAQVGELGYTTSVRLRGVVEHGTYHGGQIALLKRAV
jgi:uncharacterized damage-inducible protein DinB